MTRRPHIPTLFALPALLALCACADPRSEASRVAGARVNAENAVLIAARVPKSVVFRNEVVRLRPGGAVVCGEFNGLNRKTEWVGFTRFVYAGGEVVFDDGQPDFNLHWREDCAAS
jgi:hypothetical protein